jgi:hypothetical protein
LVKKVVEFSGEARIGRVEFPVFMINLDDLGEMDTPLSIQFALSKLVDKIMESLEKPPEPKYVAEVRLKDHLNRPVFIAVDLGKSIPPFSKEKVKARVIVEIYEEEEEEEE